MADAQFPMTMLTYEQWSDFQTDMFPKLAGRLICVTADPHTYNPDGSFAGGESPVAARVHSFWLMTDGELMDVMYSPALGTLQETITEHSQPGSVTPLILVGFTGKTERRLKEAVMKGKLSHIIRYAEPK